MPLLRTLAADTSQQPLASSSSSTTSFSSSINNASDSTDNTFHGYPSLRFFDRIASTRRKFARILAAARTPPPADDKFSVTVIEPYGDDAASVWSHDTDAPLVLHYDYAHESLGAALFALRASRVGALPFIAVDELRADLPRYLDSEMKLRFLPVTKFKMVDFAFAAFRCGFSLCCVQVNTAESLLSLSAGVSDVYVLLSGGVSSDSILFADACLRATLDRRLRAPLLLSRHALDAANALSSHAPAFFAPDRPALALQCFHLLQWWAVTQLRDSLAIVVVRALDQSELVARATNALRSAGFMMCTERVEKSLRVLLSLADCFSHLPFSSLDDCQRKLLDSLLLRELGTVDERQPQHHRSVASAALADVVLPALRDYYLTRTDSAAHARRHTTDDYASAEATLSGAVDYVQATTGIVVSRSYVYRRLLPRVPGSHEARRHVVEIRVRPAAPVKVAIDSAVDSHYCAALVRLRRLAFGSLPFERDATAPVDSVPTFLPHALTIARDDKARVHLTNSPVLRPQVRLFSFLFLSIRFFLSFLCAHTCLFVCLFFFFFCSLRSA